MVPLTAASAFSESTTRLVGLWPSSSDTVRTEQSSEEIIFSSQPTGLVR